MKKILIFYGSYGGGHLSAAKSIKSYFENNYENIEIEMFDCIEYINKLVNKLSTTAYKEMAKNAPWVWKKVYEKSENGALAKISETANKLMSKKLNTLIQDFKPDLIISTHPFSNQMCGVLKKNNKISCKIATILTDMAPHSQWLVDHQFLDYFFVSNESMKKELIISGVEESKIYVSGIPLSSRFLGGFDDEKIYNDFELDPTKKTILFFAGGEFGLGRKKTSFFFRALIKIFRDFQIVAISGRNQKMNKKFKEIVSLYGVNERVRVLDFTNNVPELMHISSFVVTKPGGLTTTESLVSNLPIIVINPIPGQEEENAKFLVDNGVAVWIKKDDNVARVLKDLYRHPEKLDEMKRNTVALAKPNSTRDICSILLNKI